MATTTIVGPCPPCCGSSNSGITLAACNCTVRSVTINSAGWPADQIDVGLPGTLFETEAGGLLSVYNGAFTLSPNPGDTDGFYNFDCGPTPPLALKMGEREDCGHRGLNIGYFIDRYHCEPYVLGDPHADREDGYILGWNGCLFCEQDGAGNGRIRFTSGILKQSFQTLECGASVCNFLNFGGTLAGLDTRTDWFNIAEGCGSMQRTYDLGRGALETFFNQTAPGDLGDDIHGTITFD